MRISPEVSQLVQIAARGAANVLITGPTGSGKSHLARQIHEQSARRSKPFVVVNLATLHEGTFESELFGHERGAFTGADQRRVGRLELAHGGTVFLDEVGELPPRLQARLLEFLQSRTITPVGSNREIKLDVRVIAATHKDLARSVRNGEFRADLFHRLRVIGFRLKSLAERAEEFDEILHSTLEELCLSVGRSVLRISADVADRLESYDWPGNLRELRNVLEYAVLASDGPEMTLQDLPAWFSGDELVEPSLIQHGEGFPPAILALDYQGAIATFEREYLKQHLARNRGRINRTARAIQINKTTLLRRIRAYGLNAEADILTPAVELSEIVGSVMPIQC